MPSLARQSLLGVLARSGLLEQARQDAAVLFGAELGFVESGSLISPVNLRQPVIVGEVELGILVLPSTGEAPRDAALNRWLALQSRALGEKVGKHRGDVERVVPAKVHLAARYLRENHREAVDLAEVAERVGMSREGLSRLFHLSLGITFSDYLLAARMETARTLLLETEQSITEIAFASGFQTVSQFHRRFRSIEKTSPRQWREAALGLRSTTASPQRRWKSVRS